MYRRGLYYCHHQNLCHLIAASGELSPSPPKLPSSHCSSRRRAVVVTTKTCVISLQQQWASCHRHHQNFRHLVVLRQRVICLRHHQNLCHLIAAAVSELLSSPPKLPSCRRHHQNFRHLIAAVVVELSSSPLKLVSSHCSSSGRAVVVTTKTCVISLYCSSG